MFTKEQNMYFSNETDSPMAKCVDFNSTSDNMFETPVSLNSVLSRLRMFFFSEQIFYSRKHWFVTSIFFHDELELSCNILFASQQFQA